MPLTEAQLEHFHERGYLPLERLLDADELAPVIGMIDADVTRRAEAFVAAGRLPRTFQEEGFERQLARIHEIDREVVQSIWREGYTHDSIFHVIRNPKLLGIAEQVCGTEELVAANGYWIRPKVPNTVDFEFPWHQDTGYLNPVCDQVLCLVVWIALVDATEERGCLCVRPYKHRPGAVLPHRRALTNPTISIAPEVLAQLEPPVCVPVPKGGAVLMHTLTPHGSHANRTDAVRWTMDVRYQSASAPSNASFTRLPGDYVPSKESDPRSGCLPSEADFLVQSRLRPDDVVRDAEGFLRVRRGYEPRPISDRWPPIDASPGGRK